MSIPMTSKVPKGYSAFSTLSPMQQSGFEQLMQMLGPLMQQSGSYYSNLLSGDPSATQAFEAPYMRQFSEQTIPGISERFAGLGAQSSSGFTQALGQAGSGLQEQLASMREGLRSQSAQMPLQALMQALGINTQGLVQKPMGFGKQLGLGVAGGVGQGLGSGLGGALGSLFGRLF